MNPSHPDSASLGNDQRPPLPASFITLPVEILTSILLDSTSNVPSSAYYRRLHQLAHVTKHWSEVLKSDPSFWTLVSCEDPPALNHLALRRSKSLPLRVILDFDPSNMDARLLEDALKEVGRWHSAELRGLDESTAKTYLADFIAETSLSILKDLKFVCPEDAVCIFTESIFAGGMPSLSKLYMNNHITLNLSHVANLTKLYIGRNTGDPTIITAGDELLRMLAACPKLVELEINSIESFWYPPEGVTLPIQLPNLVTCFLEGTRPFMAEFFRCLHIPACERLHVCSAEIPVQANEIEEQNDPTSLGDLLEPYTALTRKYVETPGSQVFLTLSPVLFALKAVGGHTDGWLSLGFLCIEDLADVMPFLRKIGLDSNPPPCSVHLRIIRSEDLDEYDEPWEYGDWAECMYEIMEWPSIDQITSIMHAQSTRDFLSLLSNPYPDTDESIEQTLWPFPRLTALHFQDVDLNDVGSEIASTVKSRRAAKRSGANAEAIKTVSIHGFKGLLGLAEAGVEIEGALQPDGALGVSLLDGPGVFEPREGLPTIAW